MKFFINMMVRDLPRTKEFFASLGFEFEAKFTNDAAAAMIVNGEAYAMLLTEQFFSDFISKEICDTSTHTEALFSLQLESRAAVDEMVNQAIAAGGTHAKPPMDHGLMYGWSFYDLDGHHWEVFWMDPAAPAPAE